jgi:hypothetical protein
MIAMKLLQEQSWQHESSCQSYSVLPITINFISKGE